MALQRVLVGSPVCERASVLRAFLISLKSLEHEGFLIDYIFIDDNDSEISEKLLKNFKREGSEVTVLPAVKGSAAEDTDARKEARLVRVAGYRNRIIRYAMQKEYDAVFLVDSDLIPHWWNICVQPGRALFQNCSGRKAAPGARPGRMHGLWRRERRIQTKGMQLYIKKKRIAERSSLRIG